MKVAEDVWTAVALLHAFVLLVVSLDGDGVSRLGSWNLWTRNLITREFFRTAHSRPHLDLWNQKRH